MKERMIYLSDVSQRPRRTDSVAFPQLISFRSWWEVLPRNSEGFVCLRMSFNCSNIPSTITCPLANHVVANWWHAVNKALMLSINCSQPGTSWARVLSLNHDQKIHILVIGALRTLQLTWKFPRILWELLIISLEPLV